MTQQPTLARNEICPLLEELIRQLDDEGRATQRAHFDRIRRSLASAQDEFTLAVPIIALNSTAAVGIELSQAVQPLHLRILEKAELLTALLAQPDARNH